MRGRVVLAGRGVTAKRPAAAEEMRETRALEEDPAKAGQPLDRRLKAAVRILEPRPDGGGPLVVVESVDQRDDRARLDESVGVQQKEKRSACLAGAAVARGTVAAVLRLHDQAGGRDLAGELRRDRVPGGVVHDDDLGARRRRRPPRARPRPFPRGSCSGRSRRNHARPGSSSRASIGSATDPRPSVSSSFIRWTFHVSIRLARSIALMRGENDPSIKRESGFPRLSLRSRSLLRLATRRRLDVPLHNWTVPPSRNVTGRDHTR